MTTGSLQTTNLRRIVRKRVPAVRTASEESAVFSAWLVAIWNMANDGDENCTAGIITATSQFAEMLGSLSIACNNKSEQVKDTMTALCGEYLFELTTAGTTELYSKATVIGRIYMQSVHEYGSYSVESVGPYYYHQSLQLKVGRCD